MALRHFTFDHGLAEEFVRFGFDHYSRDPGWIPPLASALRAQMEPGFGFYRRPGNRHRHFLCTAGGRVVGRVSAFVHADLRDRDGAPVGALGLFEATEDEGVALELIEAAVSWLTEEHGLARVWGPIHFDIWHGYRLMTRGFGEERFFGEPCNKPWYPERFAHAGFAVKQEWVTMEVRGPEALGELVDAGEDAERAFVERGFRFVPIDLRRFERELDRLHALIAAAFSGFIALTPIDREEFGRLFAVSRHGIEPELFEFVLDPRGEPVGFLGAFPDLAPAVRAMKGRGDALARLRFALARRGRWRRLVLYMGGVRPGRGRELAGLGRAGLRQAVAAARRHGCEHVLDTLVAKGSVSAALLGEHRHSVTREYALYELRR